MTATVESPGTWALAVQGVGKQFGATHALRDVSFEVRRGEVHALVGHNGCGKSTLVKIISGYQSADTGSIAVAAADGGTARMGVVHQDLGLCSPATVVENCGMGSYHRRFGMIDWKQERREVGEILASLGAEFGLDDVVSDLSPADKAITAIARALKASGGGVLLVTHHMTEVLADADRATVLASGRVVDTVDVASVTEDDLLRLIGGGKAPPKVGPGHTQAAVGNEVLTVRSLTGAAVRGLDVVVRPGEIVGLTGAAGAGHDDVPYLLSGVTRRSTGHIEVDGVPFTGRGVRDAQHSGLGVLPADRLRQGIAARGTVRENLSPASRASHRTGGVLRAKREKAWAREICREYAVTPANPEVPMSALSGGNQQKVLFARVLEHDPRILVLHEPTQGVDENTRRTLMRRVRELVDGGLGVLYVSSDAEEVAECADRVLVMRRGALVGELPAGLDHIDQIYAACYSAGDVNAAVPITEENDR